MLLFIDDGIVILIVTLIGLSSHQEVDILWSRLPSTFLPFFLVWALIASALSMYRPDNARQWRQLWRVPVAAALCALPAAWLRSVWLGTPLVPIFALVMGAVLIVGMLISRSLMILILARMYPAWTKTN